eukprot:CAMPEP_0113396348 /NCGR_PEP_ID=MMETSP0013_2-20120614/13740_1 /TAXON_ID=2843 ORGANISM="Skeletonema costatum, Strain 1716" /NCGR_SAMPLE_ID=MMETSP0013_2 /ASSEMBLY_ACC=CAM_ASM_000158 /LENGTH=232 /DNA_ID=CAMNT_0000280741 /DNA_START=25 /DNA_END=723 /DNA_ORIENTATION=+ /assembly_acc=CAM_ASM_000158
MKLSVNNSSKSNSSQLPVVAMLAVVAMLSLSTTAFLSPAAVRTHTKQRSGNSVLQYRHTTASTSDDTMEDQPILMQLANGNLAATEGTIVSSSASSFLQMMAAQHNDLSAMDEYLEYVDKRYARMHPHQVSLSTSSSPAAVVAAAVHMSTTSTTSSTTAATTIDDKAPLKKLGLSRLASAQLRHRLRQQHAKNSVTMTLLVRYVSRFLKPLTYLCGAIVVVTSFVRGNGYSA